MWGVGLGVAVVCTVLAAELASVHLPPRQDVWASAVRYRIVPAAAVVCWAFGWRRAAWALGLAGATSLAWLVGIAAWLLGGTRRAEALVVATCAANLVYHALAAACLPLALIGVHLAAASVHARKVRVLAARRAKGDP